MSLISKNPATEEILESFEEDTEKEIETKLNLAEATFGTWRKTSFEERSHLMQELAKNLREKKDELAEIVTKEMGKPFKAAKLEIEKCALMTEWYAQEAEGFLKPEIVKTAAKKSYIRFEPLGAVLAVMPWNFPFWQVLRFAVPALMAGNIAVLKHASNVPASALAIEKLFINSNFPKGAFQTFLIGSSKVEKIIKDSRIVAVALTGSEYAGSQVASQAGKEIKKSVLELGGSDPFIVLKDADIEKACTAAVIARLQGANGQSCIASKRFIIVKEVFQKFTEIYTEKVKALKLGDPLDDKTEVGPLATEGIREELAAQVKKSVALGAKIETGGKIPERKGYFYEPTVLSNITPEMPVYQEEVFGPVSTLIMVDSVEEAIRVANDTPYGLGSSIWTKDIELAEDLATKIEAGSVFINSMVKSDPKLPFGGIKKSGYGRELSAFGIKEFVNIKSVWVE